VSTATLTGIVLEGHKEAAIEVPFDPAVRWKLPMTRVEVGRWGHRVEASLNHLRFQSAIVPRANRFFLLLPPDLMKVAALEVGATVRITVHPMHGATTAPTPKARAPRPKRTREPRGAE
jgi:hypothetical protein